MISEPSAYTYCSGCYVGVHWSGDGGRRGRGVSACVPLGGSIGVSPICGRSSRDVSRCCVGVEGPRGSCSAGRVCLRTVDVVHVKTLRSMHLPRSWTRWASDKTGAAVSPTRNPTRASRTSADGVVGLSLVYNMPRPGTPMYIRKGAAFGCGPRYGRGPLDGMGCSLIEVAAR